MVRLLMDDGQNARLLSTWLENQYAVESPPDDTLDGAFDLAIIDAPTFRRLGAETLQSRKELAEPVILPYLLISHTQQIRQDPAVWRHIDDVISTPIEQDVLNGRLKSLLRKRHFSAELARENERLDRFASVISHDLRNPLTVARGRAELLDSDEHGPALERSLDRMEAIIEDVLTLTREGEDISEPEPVALETAVERAWDAVDTADGTLDCGEDLPVILADGSRLQQLLENLVRNAVEHGCEAVTVTITRTTNGFAVADDGPGIPEEKRDDVFESGYTTNRAGTGLGLDIVQTIVDAHGWDITVTASADGGARFEITDVDHCSDGVPEEFFRQ